jgi:Zn-dependent peptidase ImmA (M78 family)
MLVDFGVLDRRTACHPHIEGVAHELGHLVLHKDLNSGTRELERHAYRFAAELLMPTDSILDQLTAEKLTLFRLAALKATWGVSIQALARRARELIVNTIT